MRLGYRADIDGLRAIAVLPVVLFHAGIPGFSGGYVGVDVFFVISGFLITGIIAGEISAGSFSIVRFYERRIRRIFPALFVMLAVVLGVGYILLLPSDYDALAKTTLSALFSVSNFTFYEDAGYFDAAAIVKPLLHTWSLGVEEQYYLLLPLLLFGLSIPPMRRWRFRIILAIAAASLVTAIAATQADREFAFYLLPSRGWELLAGSLLALTIASSDTRQEVREALAAIGIAMILIPVFLFDSDTRFPGPGAILPVAGAVLVIRFAPRTATGRLLSAAPLRGIGLISYSLYLWHWPVIVFLSYWNQSALTLPKSLIAIALSFAAAILSWKYVEQPFRRGAIEHRQLWISTAAVATILAIASITINGADGLPGRFAPQVARFYGENIVSPLTSKCEPIDNFETSSRTDACIVGEHSKPPTLAVWSDSHGRPIASALYEVGAKDGSPVLRFSKGGCPPNVKLVPSTKEGCVDQNRHVLEYLGAHPEITDVVLAAYFTSSRYADDPTFADGYKEAVAALIGMGKRVVLVGPVPIQPFDVARKLSLATAFGLQLPQGVETPAYLAGNSSELALVAEAANGKAIVVRPDAMLCDEAYCAILRDGNPLYVDDNHLSKFGAHLVADKIRDALSDGAFIAGK